MPSPPRPTACRTIPSPFDHFPSGRTFGRCQSGCSWNSIDSCYSDGCGLCVRPSSISTELNCQVSRPRPCRSGESRHGGQSDKLTKRAIFVDEIALPVMGSDEAPRTVATDDDPGDASPPTSGGFRPRQMPRQGRCWHLLGDEGVPLAVHGGCRPAGDPHVRDLFGHAFWNCGKPRNLNPSGS